ncbi:nucleotidyltransferase domain-containing protein [Actinopolymorpha sp. NPDC004070]|uniref:nucleotidyltransferase domain-containing protein n=1 Tax=Actinopolymorpha sp. NPDC004070 TaxID=3154548 RepID=UPI0033B24294
MPEQYHAGFLAHGLDLDFASTDKGDRDIRWLAAAAPGGMSSMGEQRQVSSGSRMRRAAAEPLLRSYAAHPEVDAVILSGSTARGQADRWSDVEIGVFWSQPPSEGRRRELAHLARGCRLFDYYDSERCWADDLDLEPAGLLGEVVHMLTSDAETFVQDVTARFDPDPMKRNVVAGIVDGIAVDGAPVIERWRRLATPYPRELAVAVVGATGMIDHFTRWEVAHERGNSMQLAHLLSTAAKQLLDMLMALNGVYGPKPEKWQAHITTNLKVAPADLPTRLSSVFTDKPPQAAATLASLVEETYDLVESELPEVDVQRFRQVFRYARPPLET